MRNEVDFKQLKIENQQLSERCDEKNHELLQLKLRAANTLQILNTYKVRHTYTRTGIYNIAVTIHRSPLHYILWCVCVCVVEKAAQS